MTSDQVREAIELGHAPVDATGVRHVGNDWVDSLWTVQSDSAWTDGDDRSANFVWDCTGRDDTLEGVRSAE